MKAIVTGATGFIGSHLTRRLVEAAWDVHVFKRQTSSLQRIKDVVDSLEMYNVEDATNFESIWQSIGVVDVVFYLATNYGRDGQSEDEVRQTNVQLPQRLLTHATGKQVPLCITTDTCFPTSYPYLRPYTRSKREFANCGKEWAIETGNRFVNLALQHPFGPHDGQGKFVPWLIEQCLSETDAIDLTSGEQKKDFIYVGDVVDALMAIGEHSDLPTGFSEFACGSGKPRSVRGFVELIHAVTESTAKLNFGALPDREGEPAESFADTTAMNSIGWNSRTSLKEGVRLTVEWHRRNKVKC